MEKVKVIGLTSFSSIGISFFPGMEAKVEKIQADEWIKAGLVKKANEDIEDAQLVEEPKELTPEEAERKSLLQTTFQLGIELKEDFTNEELEDIIFNEMLKRKEARAVNTENTNDSDENIENQSNNTNEGTDEAEKKSKPKKKQSTTDTGEKAE